MSVHHIIFKSHLGDDLPENLINVCQYCHDCGHGRVKDQFITKAEFRQKLAEDEGRVID